MRYFKQLFLAMLLSIGLQGFAQNQKQIVEELTQKTYTLDNGDTKQQFQLKIESWRMNDITFTENAEDFEDNIRTFGPVEVVKSISVDSDMDNEYDRVMKISYTTRNQDSFRIEPTTKGFRIQVDGNYVMYDLESNDYTMSEPGKEFFTLTEK